jgi:hypothetical protein
LPPLCHARVYHAKPNGFSIRKPFPPQAGLPLTRSVMVMRRTSGTRAASRTEQADLVENFLANERARMGWPIEAAQAKDASTDAGARCHSSGTPAWRRPVR